MDTPAAKSRPVRVLQVTEAAAGGVRRHLQRLVPELRRLGIGVDVLVGTGRAEAGLADDLAGFRELGCRVAVFASAGTLMTLVRGLPALRRALREWDPDVLHLHATRAGLLGRVCRGRRCRPRVAYSAHAFAFQAPGAGLVPWLARRVERHLAAATDAFVCVADAERAAALAALPVEPARVRVIENGLEPGFREHLLPRAAVRSGWGVPPEACLIGFCGRLAPQKDPVTALRALALCRDLLPPLRLALCGDGPLAGTLRRQARDGGLEPLLQWHGFVPDLPRRMAGFDLLLLPSRYEGFPYVLLEALAAGVPVLASDLPEHLPRPWLHGPVRLVRPGDPAAWAAAIGAAVGALGERQRESAAVAAQVAQEFSVERQAAELAELYASLAQPPPAPPPGRP